MKQLLAVCLLIGLIGCIKNQSANKENSSLTSEAPQNSLEKERVLFVVSNQHTYGETDINAANHFAEIVLAYDVFKKSGFAIDFVSPEGGAIPIGYLSTSDSIEKQYLYDFEFMKLLKNTHKSEEIDPSRYSAVYYGGGGAAMFGVPENEQIQKISMAIYEENGGVVSAICHGTAGLVNLKTKEGSFLYEGKKVNGFPDLFENMDALYYQQFPFSIEQTIKERGGIFSFSAEGWDNYFVVDNRLITGQDPTAAASVAHKVVEALASK
ncbi:type 1 glutamine amidotransferase domain-containing protein [Flagellimonas allohymeniacidonis]|uniref:Type 1 glutamine amidotransferase domain-containing protein n=1 Tax=Flagellimonas allohymeniacidonis TaxID=2517819 RepID=A0A4Q8QFG0_9FLAO|nr:type 1 glutamine amidotransferase domain-containing protein [Allomuricauda hymeniacidonis]TAI46836.1 type 1 glutamine amidotransferase domain-containing protein [Allomuricauda hymeniacidonis]